MKFKYLSIILFIPLLFLLANNSDQEDACIMCHLEIDEDLDVPVMTNIMNDIHIQTGLSCSDCHGGDPDAFDDPDAAMWDDDTFMGAITKNEQPKVCGKCHSDPYYMRNYSTRIRTDQVEQYWTSRHGTLLKNGDTKVATCTNCHGVHGIYKADHPLSKVYPTEVPNTCAYCHSDEEYMAEYNIPTDQLDQYKKSVHGITLLEKQDIYSPACNDCHGNHGAIPPNVVHISDICGSCHINNKNLFQGSFHRDIFIDNGINECEACHGNHEVKHPSDDMLYWGEKSICMECHDYEDDYARDMSMAFFQTIDSLKTNLNNVEMLVAEAEQKGMEVSDLYIHLEDTRRILIQTRTNIHGFDTDELTSAAEEGFNSIDEARIGSIKALDELDYRRNGLIISSIIITFTIILLYLKLRIMKKDKT